MITLKNNSEIYERFQHLAQYILCNEGAANEVAQYAIQAINSKYKGDFDPIKIHDILDNSIDKFYHKLITALKNKDKLAENIFFEVLYKHFQYIIAKSNKFSKIDNNKMEDILQNTVILILKISRSSKDIESKGTFIQWAIQCLKNIAGDEIRKTVKNNEKHAESISQQEFNKNYSYTLQGMMSTRKEEKERGATEQELDEIVNRDFNEMLKEEYSYFGAKENSPFTYAEKQEEKEVMLSVIGKLDNQCKKIFKLLFSTRKPKYVHRYFTEQSEFRNMNEKELRRIIDMRIYHCRQNLKRQLQIEGIYE